MTNALEIFRSILPYLIILWSIGYLANSILKKVEKRQNEDYEEIKNKILALKEYIDTENEVLQNQMENMVKRIDSNHVLIFNKINELAGRQVVTRADEYDNKMLTILNKLKSDKQTPVVNIITFWKR